MFPILGTELAYIIYDEIDHGKGQRAAFQMIGHQNLCASILD